MVFQKGTKNALETGRTFSTLFQDMDLRYRLQNASTEDEFNATLWEHTKALAIEQRESKKKKHMASVSEEGTKESTHSDEEVRAHTQCSGNVAPQSNTCCYCGFISGTDLSTNCKNISQSCT